MRWYPESPPLEAAKANWDRGTTKWEAEALRLWTPCSTLVFHWWSGVAEGRDSGVAKTEVEKAWAGAAGLWSEIPSSDGSAWHWTEKVDVQCASASKFYFLSIYSTLPLPSISHKKQFPLSPVSEPQIFPVTTKGTQAAEQNSHFFSETVNPSFRVP